MIIFKIIGKPSKLLGFFLLRRAGAEFAVLATNTPHIVIAAIPLISSVEAAHDEAQ
ncbi:hypothetical protein [Planococcus lenghuensis]|uniref:hypothetical protein n=1 Tax=Planococcus lenghuensis TaxID=2213202 RepID=UPI0012ECA5EE|nr:hypothetical protein [Planococcus lenghuensis]